MFDFGKYLFQKMHESESDVFWKKALPEVEHWIQKQLLNELVPNYYCSATKTMGDSNFPNRPALGQLNLIE